MYFMATLDPRAAIFDIDYQSLSEFRYKIRKFLHFSEQAARANHLEAQQHQLLLAIKGLPTGSAPPLPSWLPDY